MELVGKMSQNVAIGVQFEWARHEKYLLYQSSVMSFKIKREKLEVTTGDEPTHGFEVYISDNPKIKEWRSIRLFKEDGQEVINKAMRWVEAFAIRLTEEKAFSKE